MPPGSEQGLWEQPKLGVCVWGGSEETVKGGFLEEVAYS